MKMLNKWPIRVFIRELRSGGNIQTIEDVGRRKEIEGVWYMQFKGYKIKKTKISNDLLEKTNKGNHYGYFFSPKKGDLIQVPPFSTGGFLTTREERDKRREELDNLPVTDESVYLEHIALIEAEIKNIDSSDSDSHLKYEEKRKLNVRKDNITKALGALREMSKEEKEEYEKKRSYLEDVLDEKNSLFLPRVSQEDEYEIVNNAEKRVKRYQNKKGWMEKYGHFAVILVLGMTSMFLLYVTFTETGKIIADINTKTLPAINNLAGAMNKYNELKEIELKATGIEVAGKPPPP